MWLVKAFLKVPLVFMENILFSIFPLSRPLIEKYLFNPYQFNNWHIKYSKKQFEKFTKKIGGIQNIAGKTILELGPGGSIGFGILALKNGAKKYYAIEDGIHTFLTKNQIIGYRNLLENSPFFDDFFVENNKKFYYNPEKIKFISIGQDSKYSLPDNSIDIIYSCAVLEHVSDLDLCFSEMTRVLRLNGIMNHQVDLRDHIFFQNSLWFLAISNKWFNILFKKTGEYVNRKRFSYYKELFRRNNLEIIEFEKSIVFEGAIPKKLTHLYSEDDLRTLSFNIKLLKNVRDNRKNNFQQ